MNGAPFTNPFRYCPHPLVRKAAKEVAERLDDMIDSGILPEEAAKSFKEGKMLGVLVCEDRYLAAFSGNAGGMSSIEGFVPPIFDLTQDDGYYRRHEVEISAISIRIEQMQKRELEPLENKLKELIDSREAELEMLRNEKKKAQSISESQFANGQIKRSKDRWKEKISCHESELQAVRESISVLKKQRACRSDELQRWIFGQYIVQNAAGSRASILEIFQKQGLMPPGGTGDCAAPKLLNYAFSNGLKPIAMGEFWYGKSPATAVRTHGHFYPSCTSKCGPLLSYMLKGLATSLEAWNGNPEAAIIYEDESIVAASKPSGMPSVPGLDGRISLQEYLEKEMQMDLFAVHRLDMDTSGIIIFAKTPQAESDLKKQFEEHSIRKTYMARLSPADTHRIASSTRVLKPGDKGTIELPLSPDYDERPRQKVDHTQGKPSLTGYEVVSMNEDGTTDILFYPHTGRTHQLRVHSAHILGLGRPILGDLLYGGCGTAWSDISQWNESSACIRLHLHAQSITFRHPSTSETLTLTALADPSIR